VEKPYRAAPVVIFKGVMALWEKAQRGSGSVEGATRREKGWGGVLGLTGGQRLAGTTRVRRPRVGSGSGMPHGRVLVRTGETGAPTCGLS
jgi:hypothetical protein